jgi:hypothetical protein
MRRWRRFAGVARLGVLGVGVVGVGVFGLAWPSAAEAATECSAENWFCDDEEAESEDASAPSGDDDVVEGAPEEGPPKRRRSKPREVAPEPAPTTCQPEVVVEVRVCETAPPSPPPPPETPPAEEEEELGAVGLSVSGLLRYVGGSEGRGGALLGGGAISLRLRPVEDFAFDVGFAAMGGPEDGDRGRGEVSGFTDLLWYPMVGEVRAYFLVGGEVVGATSSWASADGTEHSESLEYVAPRGGLGLELGGSDWGVFFDGIVAPRFPTNEAASAELRGDDFHTTVQLRSGIVAFW